MGIKKNADGTYTVSYSKRHPVTRQPVSRLRKGVKTQNEAKRVLADLIVIVNDRLKKQVIPVWSDFLDLYFIEMGNLGAMNQGTIYNRSKVIRSHTLEPWGTRCIDEISPQDIQKILNEKFAGMQESHKNFFLKCVRGVFQHAYNQGLITRNPTPTMKFKINEKIKSVLNEGQIIQLLKKSQELSWVWYPHYAMALYTGMRNGELYALRWDNVNIDQRQILINCSWSNIAGFKSTKSGDDRLVEIPKPLLPVLMELKIKSNGNEFVLPRLYKWDKGEQARELRFFLGSIGLPLIRFHDLRASWATLLLGKGVAPSKVMAMGGWKDMDTMMIYMRKAGINIKNATSCLDDMQTHGVEGGKVLNLPFS